MNAPEFASLAAWSNIDDSRPRAFLNYIVFDDNFQVQDFGVQQVGEEAEIPLDGSAMTHPHQKLTLDVTIEKQGYIYVYLSVDDRQNMDVYWDDFKVTHHLNDIVAGGDYYPFGSVMAGREITRDDYRFGYQGQFSEYDEETGWNSFELRMYDPVIGRWMAVDPYGQYSSPYLGMGNSPINLFDPNGGFTGGDDKFPTETVAGVEGIMLNDVVVGASKMSGLEAFRYDQKVGGSWYGGTSLFLSELSGWRTRTYVYYYNSYLNSFDLNVGVGVAVNGYTPIGGVGFSLENVYTDGDNRNDLYLTMSLGWGLDVSAGGYGVKYFNNKESITSSNIEGVSLFHSLSMAGIDNNTSYTLTLDRPGQIVPSFGRTIGTTVGGSIGATSPFIVNGSVGVSYTWNLTKMFGE